MSQAPSPLPKRMGTVAITEFSKLLKSSPLITETASKTWTCLTARSLRELPAYRILPYSKTHSPSPLILSLALENLTQPFHPPSCSPAPGVPEDPVWGPPSSVQIIPVQARKGCGGQGVLEVPQALGAQLPGPGHHPWPPSHSDAGPLSPA